MSYAVGKSEFADQVCIGAFSRATDDGEVNVALRADLGECFKQIRQTF